MKIPNPVTLAAAVRDTVRSLWKTDRLLASPELTTKRRMICRANDGGCYNGGLDQCQECSCVVTLKTMLLAQKCPLRKWPEK